MFEKTTDMDFIHRASEQGDQEILSQRFAAVDLAGVK